MNDTSPPELAMRVLLLVGAVHKVDPHFVMGDVVDKVRARFGISKSTAFRRVRTATDVLCIHYAPSRERLNDKLSEGQFKRRVSSQVKSCSSGR